VIGNDSRKRRRDEEVKQKLDEIRKTLRRLKGGEAIGVDEILNEVWKYRSIGTKRMG
jgi:hypothetical protein